MDIVIPAATKDFGVLETVVENLKLNIKHPINKIFIVSKDNPDIKTFCTRYNLNFIEESSILGYSPDKIKYTCNGEDRSGWLYQQLIKLKGDAISDLDFFLVLDSDTIFVKPVIFIDTDKRILDFSDEYHVPYYEVYSRLLKTKHLSRVSYVTHYMLFERKKLQELRREIEICNGNQKWDDVILQNVNYSQCSGFSEYETYANFVLSKYPEEYIISYWFNKSDVSFSSNYPGFYKTVSVHSYLK